MERRDFIHRSVLTTAAFAGLGSVTGIAKPQPRGKEVYEFRIYHMRRNMTPLNNYLSKALIPALNRMGSRNVGVFSELSKAEPAKIYMVIPYASFEEFGKTTLALKNDAQFAEASREYSSVPVDQAVYERYDSNLLLAFDGQPRMTVPSPKAKLFELRIYEGYSEDAVRRKVKMFNDGEIDIFKDVKLPAVFYSENIIGKYQPALTYMAGYQSMEEREQVWKDFLVHPEWQKMSKMTEYANTVSKIHKIFLEPMPYSQI